MIKDLLRQLDLDYFRSMLLHAVRAELERLRQERSAGRGLDPCGASPFRASSTADGEASSEAAGTGGPNDGSRMRDE